MFEIIGTITENGKNVSFAYNSKANAIELDVFKPKTEKSDLTPIQQAECIGKIRELIGAVEIRFDEYFCGVCKNWFNANKQEWSVGICLSCSLDRGSELSAMFD